MSKGLDSLDKITRYINPIYGKNLIAQYREAMDNVAIVRKNLLALEIIKENHVQISWFTMLLKSDPKYTHDDYNFGIADNRKLTKEEYELLKEVLS